MFARFMLTKITAMDSEQENTAPQGPPPPDAIKKPDLPPPSLPKPSIPDATSSEPISSGPPVLTPPPPKPEPTPPTVVEEALPPGSIAPLNPRLIAFLIDALIGIGILLVVGTVIPGLSRVGALAMLVYIATRDALPFLKGQSIGKKVMNLQAVTLDGKSLAGNWEPGLIRNALLIIPVFTVVELIVLLIRDNKPERGYRLGDEWAKTKVITVAPSIPKA